METLDLSKLSKQELLAMVEAQRQNASTGLIVKVTEKGGIYIRHNSFLEFSTAKGKEYVAGINIGFVTAKALFNNPELLEQIKKSINTLK